MSERSLPTTKEMNDLPISRHDRGRFLERTVFVLVMLCCLFMHLGGKLSERATVTNGIVHSLHIMKAGSEHTIVLYHLSNPNTCHLFLHTCSDLTTHQSMHTCLPSL